MNPLIAILIAVAPATAHPVVKPSIQYVLRVDSTDLSGWSVTMYLRSRGEPIRLAMAAHPEYDDRYWRYVRDVTVDPPNATVERVDSAVWQVDAPRGTVTLHYRLALPAPERPSRASWSVSCGNGTSSRAAFATGWSIGRCPTRPHSIPRRSSQACRPSCIKRSRSSAARRIANTRSSCRTAPTARSCTKTPSRSARPAAIWHGSAG